MIIPMNKPHQTSHPHPGGFLLKRFPDRAVIHAWHAGAETITVLDKTQLSKMTEVLNSDDCLIFTAGGVTVRKNYDTIKLSV